MPSRLSRLQNVTAYCVARGDFLSHGPPAFTPAGVVLPAGIPGMPTTLLQASSLCVSLLITSIRGVEAQKTRVGFKPLTRTACPQVL